MTGPGEDAEPITDLGSALRRLARHPGQLTETDHPVARRTTAFGDTPW
ncbi:hypothetical protein [Nocardia sp. NPDC047648]